MRKYRKLQNTVLGSFIVLALVLILIISLVVGDQYIRGTMEDCRTTAFSYTKSAAKLIDGDKIAHYIETEEKDDYYYEILDVLNSFRLNTDIQYFYVFVPFEDDLVYIWDADALKPDETEIDACELGYHEEYMEGGKEATYAIYKQNPPEEIELVNDDKYGFIASAYSPVFNSNGEPVAVVGVDVYMPDLQANMRKFLVVVIVAIMLVVLAAILLCYFFVKRKIVNPINKIRDTSKTMVETLESEDSIDVTVNTGNEIEELFDTFKQMYKDVKDYIRKLSNLTAEKERIGAELDIAKHIQASMLPCIFPAFPDKKEIGKTLIKDHTFPERDLGEVFTAVNNLLCEANSEGLFITAFEGVLDLVTGEFTFVNAGHEMPFICKAGGNFEAQKIRAGFVLAGMEDMKYKAGTMQFDVGDKIFQYTDGVTEATNINNELYGMDRLGEILNKVKNGTPHEILPAVKADIDEFVGEAPQFDDITMLCLEYKARMEDAQ